jgi:hypothetical protein
MELSILDPLIKGKLYYEIVGYRLAKKTSRHKFAVL